MPTASIDRPQSRGEEFANSISHGIGAVALACASPFLILSAARHGDAALLTGVCIFAFTAMLVYLASAIYHAVPPGSPMKRALAVVDHSAIYLMIAGTYTPFTLGVLRGSWGWTVFGVVWALAIAGVCLKIWHGVDRHKRFSLALYLGMGWLALAVIGRLWTVMPHGGFYLLVAGGVFYSAGVPFYVSKIAPYRHFVWHLFVLAGSACHFLAVFSCCG